MKSTLIITSLLLLVSLPAMAEVSLGWKDFTFESYLEAGYYQDHDELYFSLEENQFKINWLYAKARGHLFPGLFAKLKIVGHGGDSVKVDSAYLSWDKWSWGQIMIGRVDSPFGAFCRLRRISNYWAYRDHT